MFQFKKSKFLSYTVYFLLLEISSEILYRLYLTYKNRTKTKNKVKNKDTDGDESPVEINDVIWSSDMNFSCPDDHCKSKNVCDSEHCYFDNINRIVSMIDNAKYNIDLAMYMFTSVELHEALMNAFFKRNIKIRIICDQLMADNSSSAVISLNEAGIPTCFYSDSNGTCMHHKFCIIDGLKLQESKEKNDNEKIKPLLLTGSTNWTFQGFARNWDNIVITSNKKLIDNFQKQFNNMWQFFNINKNIKNKEKALVNLPNDIEYEMSSY